MTSASTWRKWKKRWLHMLYGRIRKPGILFIFSSLLKYNWHVTLFKVKVYNMIIGHTHTHVIYIIYNVEWAAPGLKVTEFSKTECKQNLTPNPTLGNSGLTWFSWHLSIKVLEMPSTLKLELKNHQPNVNDFLLIICLLYTSDAADDVSTV